MPRGARICGSGCGWRGCGPTASADPPPFSQACRFGWMPEPDFTDLAAWCGEVSTPLRSARCGEKQKAHSMTNPTPPVEPATPPPADAPPAPPTPAPPAAPAPPPDPAEG